MLTSKSETCSGNGGVGSAHPLAHEHHIANPFNEELEGRYRLIFPDGSVLNGCRHRRSKKVPAAEWYLFNGRQFRAQELRRWDVEIESV